jgi:hypothetical protein
MFRKLLKGTAAANPFLFPKQRVAKTLVWARAGGMKLWDFSPLSVHGLM